MRPTLLRNVGRKQRNTEQLTSASVLIQVRCRSGFGLLSATVANNNGRARHQSHDADPFQDQQSQGPPPGPCLDFDDIRYAKQGEKHGQTPSYWERGAAKASASGEYSDRHQPPLAGFQTIEKRGDVQM